VTRPFLAEPRPHVFAHRGGAGLRPENTLEAFRHAMALGYRHLETDVRMTRDGALVLFHDATLDRTTDGHGPLAERSLAELRALDAGYHFTSDGVGFPYRGRGLTIPTIDELLALEGAFFNIEIKAPGDRVRRAFWDALERHAAHDRVLVAAEHGRIGRAFRKLARGRVATSAASDEALAFWAAARAGLTRWLPIHYDALQLPESYRGLRVVDSRLVSAAHARGLAVHVWTVDEPDAMRRLLALGVDGLMTDRPDRLAPSGAVIEAA
jgi:glycerophosphoryl diester phosphodiesterase